MPHSGDQDFAGLARNPDFVAAELADEEVHGGGPDELVVLPNPAPAFNIPDNVEIDEPALIGNREPVLFNPIAHDRINR